MARVTKRRLAITLLCAAVIVAGVLHLSLSKPVLPDVTIPPEPVLYRTTILPSPNGANVHAEALNDVGQVACVEWTRLGGRTLLWHPRDGTQDVGPYPQGRLFLDNAGNVAGTTAEPNGQRAFLWEPGKGKILLSTLGGESVAKAMNNRGQILGICLPQGIFHVVLWDKSVGLKDLRKSGEEPHLESINDAGQIIIRQTSSPRWLLRDPNGRETTLDGVPNGWMPGSVNNNSCVAGFDKANHRLMLLAGQGKTVYSPAISGDLHNATKLNDKNQIAYTVSHNPSRWQGLLQRFSNRVFTIEYASYLWDPVRGLVPLDKYVHGMRRFWVRDLNNNGFIVGDGVTQDGKACVILLEPIPERWGK
jgi:hypothetical protein